MFQPVKSTPRIGPRNSAGHRTPFRFLSLSMRRSAVIVSRDLRDGCSGVTPADFANASRERRLRRQRRMSLTLASDPISCTMSFASKRPAACSSSRSNVVSVIANHSACEPKAIRNRRSSRKSADGGVSSQPMGDVIADAPHYEGRRNSESSASWPVDRGASSAHRPAS